MLPGDGSFVWLFVLVFFLGAAGIIVSLVLEKRRREAFQKEAAGLGLEYLADPGRDFVSRLPHLGPLHQRGKNHRARHLMRGAHRGVPVHLFEYVYQTTSGSGKDQRNQTHRFGVALCPGPVAAPWLRVVPEHWGHKLYDALGGEDIDFESDEFSRKYWVQSRNRRFAYDVIDARMMEFLLEPGWSRWEWEGQTLVLWTAGRHRPDEARAVLDRLTGFLERVPRHVRVAMQGAGAVTP